MDDTTRYTDAIVDRAIARMGDHGRDPRVQQQLEIAVKEAFATGRSKAWNGVHDVGAVADFLDVTTSYVRRLARTHGIGERFGRDWMFRDDDMQALRELTGRGT